MTWPVMYDESSDASKTNAGAISSGWPGRSIGTSAPSVVTVSSGNADKITGFQFGPGATALTRLP